MRTKDVAVVVGCVAGSLSFGGNGVQELGSIHYRKGVRVEWHVFKVEFVDAPVGAGCFEKAGDGRDSPADH